MREAGSFGYNLPLTSASRHSSRLRPLMPVPPDQSAVFDSSIDWEKKRIRTVITGHVHLKEVEEYVAKKTDEGTMSFADLIDCRNTQTAITAHDIHHLVDILRRLASGINLGRVAILVSHGDSITFGMARMMAALIEGTLSIQPFREVGEAEKWLGWTESE